MSKFPKKPTSKLRIIIILIPSVIAMLLGGLMIGYSCSYYAVTFCDMNLMPAVSMLGMVLLLLGLPGLNFNLNRSKRFGLIYLRAIFIFDVLLAAFGMYVAISSKYDLDKRYAHSDSMYVVPPNDVCVFIAIAAILTLTGYVVMKWNYIKNRFN